jgi:hypothetical protein
MQFWRRWRVSEPDNYTKEECEAGIDAAYKHLDDRAKAEASEREIRADEVTTIAERLMDERFVVTADPGSEEPANFEMDKRTKVAIAAWLLDIRLAEVRDD